jgi:hypothetical protein
LPVTLVSLTFISTTAIMGDIEEELGRIYHLVGELSGRPPPTHVREAVLTI